MAEKKEKKLTYEDAVKEIEQIIEKLEENNISLKESQKLLERGAFLIDFCNKTFKEVKGSITIIQDNIEKSFKTE